MKKQVKQRDEQTKQNTNANSNENRTPVSDETKQKLVKQYADRAEQSSNRNMGTQPEGTEWSDFNLRKNGMDIDGFVSDKNINKAYTVPYADSLGEALNNVPWGAQSSFSTTGPTTHDLTMEQLNNAVNAMSNDAVANRENTNLSPNMLYGYGDAPRDFFSRYDTPAEKPEGYSSVYQFLEDEGLDDWVTNSGIADSGVDQLNAARAFQLMQNANDYYRQQELDQWAQQYRDNQLYGDALTELMAQRQAQQGNNRSLLDDVLTQINIDNRPRPRKRNITGSAVW